MSYEKRTAAYSKDWAQLQEELPLICGKAKLPQALRCWQLLIVFGLDTEAIKGRAQIQPTVDHSRCRVPTGHHMANHLEGIHVLVLADSCKIFLKRTFAEDSFTQF